MLHAEKESNLIESFQNLETHEIFLTSETAEIEEILLSIYDKNLWNKWTDSSAKDVPPPDFYSDELGLMMEVMRVDDHGFKKKGNIINPTYDREHQMEKELRDSGLLSMFPNASLHIIANTGLPTEQDHNYKYYLANFKRTVENHVKKIPKYRANHTNHKLIFFVYDESSAYFEEPQTLHMFMLDKAFLEVFEKADIDYLIWFAPYKHIEYIEPPITLPKACLYKISESLPFEYDYNADKMVSFER